MLQPNGFSFRQKIGFFFLLAAIASGAGMLFSYSNELLVIGLACFVLGAVLLVWKDPAELKGLLEKKRKIEGEIAEAEKKCLNRELSEEAFRSFSFQKQKELIGIESRIAELKQQQGEGSEEELKQIASSKKHVLKELLQQKKAVEAELQISEQKYLNRELGEKEFFEVQHNAQARLVELDAEIKNLYAGENVEAVLSEMQQKLKETEPLRRRRRREPAADVDEMAEELLEQSKKDEEKS